jgi:hypothetical protein
MARDRYEVIRINFDDGDLSQINLYAADGWMVCGCWTEKILGDFYHYAMLQRKLPNRVEYVTVIPDNPEISR